MFSRINLWVSLEFPQHHIVNSEGFLSSTLKALNSSIDFSGQIAEVLVYGSQKTFGQKLRVQVPVAPINL